MDQTADQTPKGAASLQEDFHRIYADSESYIRQNPTKASMVAIGIGFLLAQLPLRWMLVAIIKLVFLLVKPATFIYAVSKLIDDVRGSHAE